MSMGLLVGFIIADPMNGWLVANHLKHGMMMVRPASAGGRVSAHNAHGPELTALTPARVVRPMVSILCP